ncbi:hypothetical protein GIB67_039070 [Kingdonia uniflora]|uniref:Cation efflux protein transmembrane domain-containing protein n=1 Tax=Kingdonia uniflora TaxID=39325 RepID=A0A7J7LKX4_9MAGN|nr:hypothetical protein GIB67_039070 [Kingdonia uniflora]
MIGGSHCFHVVNPAVTLNLEITRFGIDYVEDDVDGGWSCGNRCEIAAFWQSLALESARVGDLMDFDHVAVVHMVEMFLLSLIFNLDDFKLFVIVVILAFSTVLHRAEARSPNNVAIRYCGTAATILAELCGNVGARFVAEGGRSDRNAGGSSYAGKVRGFVALCIGLLLLSISWDRVECFPLNLLNVGSLGFRLVPSVNCVKVLPMLLPFLSGFLGCYERVAMNWGSIRQLGRKRVRLISLLFTTVVLFFPAVISFFLIEQSGDAISFGNLGWPLVNTVVFGVLLSESYGDEKLASSKDFRREFVVTFACTVVLELFYFPELSLFGLLLCGFLIWLSVRELDPVSLNYPELGLDSSDSFSSMVMKPVCHILSERKSQKIALFLLINTAYMVVEFVAGFMNNSLGLISDACHMLFDCAALAIGLYASYISRLPANGQFNYGRGRFEVLSGYVNAVFLVLVGVLIVLESFERILDPQEISTNSLLVVSIGGLLVNVVGLIFFHEEHHHAHGGGGSCSHSHSHSHQNENSHQHGHNEHSHQHGHHDHHDHHDHDHQHDRDAHSHQHDHDAHSHQHDSHDHCHQHDHHEHCHQRHHHHDKEHVHHPERSNEAHFHEDPHLVEDNHAHSHSTIVDGDLRSKDLSQEKELLREPQKKHRHIDHNMEGIFLHVLADTMGSVGVVFSTILIKYKGWVVADPACSIFISVMIIASVIPLLRNSAEILLQRIPRAHEQDLKLALEDVMKIRGVHSIEDVNVWSFTNTDVVGTLHFHVSEGTDKVSAKAQTAQILHDAGVKDLTVQMEYVRKK